MNQVLKMLKSGDVEVNDKLIIHPFDGRKSYYQIKRTLIEITLGCVEDFSLQQNKIYLKGINQKGTYALKAGDTTLGRGFYIETLKGAPFNLNGNLCFHAFVRPNDVVDFEYNRICFKKNGVARLEKEELPFGHWPKDAYVYLEGETGTGKSRLAKLLHDRFVGEERPFHHINLTSFNENLLESEIFGHEKGSFTGAVKEKKGAVELAQNGTLFFDEIDSLPLHLQVKLLLYLDHMTFFRVGGERQRKSDCRIILSSGTNLYEKVKRGDFRQDFYYRVTSGIKHRILPLRERKTLIRDICREFERERAISIDPGLLKYLEEFFWPGNIRQLKSHLNRKYLMNENQKILKIDGLEDDLVYHNDIQTGNDVLVSLDEVKREYCKKVLAYYSGNSNLACETLSIAKSTLKRLTG